MVAGEGGVAVTTGVGIAADAVGKRSAQLDVRGDLDRSLESLGLPLGQIQRAGHGDGGYAEDRLGPAPDTGHAALRCG